jgi:pimeloyl-ACP methyl ester carboxylesterase
MNTREIEANGLTFKCRELGDGEPVLLLHGFPETSHMWTELMPVLAEAGYRCLAPDQRGYSPGARPAELNSYRYEEIGGDVLAIARAAGFEKFHLIGHDWGAGAGWLVLAIDPSPVQSFVAMSVPHMLGFAQAVRDDPEEEAYRGMLQIFTDPNSAAAMAADDAAGFRAAAWTSSPPEQVEDYVSVFKDAAAVQAALNWYVAGDAHMRLLDDESFKVGPVDVPTLLLWGKNDAYIRRMALDMAEPYMKGQYRVVELDAGHWLIQEQPEQVRDEILAHLRANAL